MTESTIALCVALIAVSMAWRLFRRLKPKAVCIWCGEEYQAHTESGIFTSEEIIELIRQHHEHCPKNPIRIRADAFQEELFRCRNEREKYRW